MTPVPAILDVIGILLNLIIYVLIAQVILSWLLAFNVISTRSPAVRQIVYYLDRVTAPLLRPIRRVLPDFGGLDFAPLVLWIAIIIFERHVLYPLQAGTL